MDRRSFLNALAGAAGLAAAAARPRAAPSGQSDAQFPEAWLSNGEIKARIYLPDPVRGYYRATRFDWSGVIASLEYHGHNFFGQWFDHYDPHIHDSISGPVEEFRTGNAPLGYA